MNVGRCVGVRIRITCVVSLLRGTVGASDPEVFGAAGGRHFGLAVAGQLFVGFGAHVAGGVICKEITIFLRRVEVAGL